MKIADLSLLKVYIYTHTPHIAEMILILLQEKFELVVYTGITSSRNRICIVCHSKCSKVTSTS